MHGTTVKKIVDVNYLYNNVMCEITNTHTHNIRINTILLSEGTISSDNTPVEQSFLSTPTPTVSGDGRQRSVRRCSTLP